MGFKKDFEKSIQYDKEIVEILNKNECQKVLTSPIILTIRDGTNKEDTKLIGDKVVNFTVPSQINLGIRTLFKFYNNITIRATTPYAGYDNRIKNWRPTKYQTEIQKIIEGVGDFLCFFWVSKSKINRYLIVSCNKLRESGLLNIPYYNRKISPELFYHSNGDRTGFFAIGIDLLKRKGCIVLDSKDVIDRKTLVNAWEGVF